VNILKHYTDRADEIIGERTADEQKYDREVIRWLRRGKSISKAIAKANEKCPTEALQVDKDNVADVQAHYEYLADHEAITEKLNALKKIGLEL
jgi:putative NADH-flavin reductase